jgi:hypothetical protein
MSLTVIGESETNERKKNEEENFHSLFLFRSSSFLCFINKPIERGKVTFLMFISLERKKEIHLIIYQNK